MLRLSWAIATDCCFLVLLAEIWPKGRILISFCDLLYQQQSVIVKLALLYSLEDFVLYLFLLLIELLRTEAQTRKLRFLDVKVPDLLNFSFVLWADLAFEYFDFLSCLQSSFDSCIKKLRSKSTYFCFVGSADAVEGVGRCQHQAARDQYSSGKRFLNDVAVVLCHYGADAAIGVKPQVSSVDLFPPVSAWHNNRVVVEVFLDFQVLLRVYLVCGAWRISWRGGSLSLSVLLFRLGVSHSYFIKIIKISN